MKVMISASLLFLTQSLFAQMVPLGTYRGEREGKSCYMKVLSVITDQNKIKRILKKELREEINDQEIPNYVLKVKFPHTSRALYISGDEKANILDDYEINLGAMARISGMRGYFPVPFFSIAEILIDKNRIPLTYGYAQLPIYQNYECKNLKKID